MIRLYLNNYKLSELVQLYNAFNLARSSVAADVAVDAPNNPIKDLDESLVYLSGYMDGKGDK